MQPQRYMDMKSLLKILMIMAIAGASTACAQHSTAGYSVVSPQEFAADIQNDSTAYILDVRTPQEFAQGHIAGAHNLDWLNPEFFKPDAMKLPKDSTIYVYCRSGRRSAEAAQYLSSLGYKVIDLDGGYLAWQESRSN